MRLEKASRDFTDEVFAVSPSNVAYVPAEFCCSIDVLNKSLLLLLHSKQNSILMYMEEPTIEL